jgi:hypothetical protein
MSEFRCTRPRRLRRVGARALLFALPALVLLLGAAQAATAAPQEPTMSVARLEELLAASPSGTVDASFKTVVKGDVIVDIPCVIEGIVPQAAADNGDLIMFQASGPIIDKAGGIAAGMSGSPVYVEDGGAKLVAAVSYGAYFTSNGLGLATPVEHMMTLEDDFDIDPLSAVLAKSIGLRAAIDVGDGVVSRVIVAPTTRAARRAEAGPRTVVMRPLSRLLIGGVPADSDSFRAVKAAFADEGIEVRGGLAGGAAGSDPDFETELVPGSSVGELFMRGDVWYGGVGTTTYTTADGKLVAFGHPMMWDGYLSAYLTNADVIGVWNSAEEPYKVVAPGKARGAITVDSGPGIAGVVGDAAIPGEVPLTCTATDTATGKSVTTTSYVTQWAADQSKYPYWYVNALSFYPALYRATGDSQYDGHLVYTLSIAMTDGVDDYTITRHNTWEDSYDYDASFLVVWELASFLTTLTADPDGTINPHVTSIDVDCAFSPQLDRARIVDVTVPGGVKTGDNVVRVTYYAYGQTAAQTVDVPLTVPEGMSTRGTVYAKAPFTNVQSDGDGWFSFWTYGEENTDPPQTLAVVVAGLDAAPGNDQLLVSYDPPGGPDDWWGMGEPWSEDAVTAQVGMGTYLTGSATKTQASMQVYQESWPVVTGGPVALSGSVSAEGVDLEGETVKIYTRDVGETVDTFVTEVPIETIVSDDTSENTFRATIPAVKHTTTVTAAWDGNADYLRSTCSTVVEVEALVGLRARVTAAGAVRLTATVRPADTGGKVVFRRIVNGAQRTIAKVDVGTTGKATRTWKPRHGTYRVTATFLGSDRNTEARSRTVRVVVK